LRSSPPRSTPTLKEPVILPALSSIPRRFPDGTVWARWRRTFVLSGITTRTSGKSPSSPTPLWAVLPKRSRLTSCQRRSGTFRPGKSRRHDNGSWIELPPEQSQSAPTTMATPGAWVAFPGDVAPPAAIGHRHSGGGMRLPVLLVSVLVLPARLQPRCGGGAASDDRTAVAHPPRGGVPAREVRVVWRRRERALALDLGALGTPSSVVSAGAAVDLRQRPCRPGSARSSDARFREVEPDESRYSRIPSSFLKISSAGTTVSRSGANGTRDTIAT